MIMFNLFFTSNTAAGEIALQLTLETLITPAGFAIWFLLGSVLLVSPDHQSSGRPHWLMFVLALWISGGILESGATTMGVFFSGIMLAHVAAILIPPVGFSVLEHYCSLAVPKAVRTIIWMIPVASIVVLTVPEWRASMWSLGSAFSLEQRPVTLIRGEWFKMIHAPFSFGLCAISILLMIRHGFRVPAWARFSTLAFAALAVLPMLASTARILGYPIPFATSTGTIIAIIAPAAAWLILRHGVLLAGNLEHHALFDQMKDAVVVVDTEDTLIGFNSAALDLLDGAARALKGQRLADAFPALANELADFHSDEEETREFTVNDRRIGLRVSGIIREGNQQRLRLIIGHDVSQSFKTRQALKRNEELLRTLIHHSSNAILRVRLKKDEHGVNDFVVLVANPAGAELFETTEAQLIGKTLSRQLYGSEVTNRQYALQNIVPTLQEALASDERRDLEFCVSQHGAKRWYRLLADPVGEDIGMTFIDISSEREHHDALQSAALHDPLTQVLNRRGFEQAAGGHLASADDLSHGALLFIDLNDFKQINDVHGHAAGDLVLQEVARRLHADLRPQDIIGRQGGDEFVVLVTDSSFEDSGTLQNRVSTRLALPYRMDGKELQCSASVGIAKYPEDAVTLTSLMRHADASMYTEKASRRASQTKLSKDRHLKIAD
ncbi:MAG: diguanylate cyclase [Woeseiaceae bacterium]